MADCSCSKLLAVRGKETIGGDHESARPLFDQSFKYTIKVGHSAGVQDMQPHAPGVRGRLQASQL
jgi:hypothetical protein